MMVSSPKFGIVFFLNGLFLLIRHRDTVAAALGKIIHINLLFHRYITENGVLTFIFITKENQRQKIGNNKNEAQQKKRGQKESRLQYKREIHRQ